MLQQLGIALELAGAAIILWAAHVTCCQRLKRLDDDNLPEAFRRLHNQLRRQFRAERLGFLILAGGLMLQF